MPSKTVRSATLEPEDTPEPPLMTARQAAGPVASAVRMGDPEREATARQNLAEAKIAEAITKALANAPKLTPAQIGRLSNLLRSSGERQPRVVNR